MRLPRALIFVVALTVVLAGDAGASFPGRDGLIVYASPLVPAPASGVVELELGARPVRRSLTARTGISGLLPTESPDGRMIAFVRDRRIFVGSRDGGGVRDLGRGLRPTWSPDGRELAFSVEDPYFTVVVADVATGERRKLGYGSNPSWSPDGRRIAFVNHDGLGVVNADASGYRIVWPQLLPDWYHLDAPAWSPDGRRIAFSTVSVVYEGDSYGPGIAIFEPATGFSVALREWGRHPSWSPSGTSLVYVRTRGRKTLKEIVELDVERQVRRVVATTPFSSQCEGGLGTRGLVLGASYAPTGNRVAFASSVRRNGRCRVVVGTVQPGRPARVVHSEPWGTRPADFVGDEVGEPGPRWLRDGRSIWLAVERRTLLPELYARREDGTGLRRLTRSPAAEQDPRFSADGRRIVFVRGKRGRDGVIWVADATGRGARPLGRGAYPTWSPDGRRIAFTRRDALYAMSANGGRPVLLERGPAAMPSWSAGGRLIAFARVGVAVEREPYEARSAGIFVLDVRTRRVRRLTYDGLFPNWSPDGRVIAYTLWDVGPSELDEQKSYRYPFLRFVTRAGETVDPGSRYVDAYDVAWAPAGDRLVGSGLTIIRPPVLGATGGLHTAALHGLLGIAVAEQDPDWQP